MGKSVKFKSPQQLLDAYSNGFVGAYCNIEHLQALLASLAEPNFSTAGYRLHGSGAGKLSTPYKSVIKLSPVQPYLERQTTGDCVSHGTRNAVDVSRAVQIDVQNVLESFVTIGATEAIYGCRGQGGEGMACSEAAEFVNSAGGIVLRQNYPGVQDFSTYNGNLGAGWGSRGVPEAVLAIARQHQVKTITQINSVEQARDALANGYGLAICSNQGFSSERDSKGFARPEGNWGHCGLFDSIVSSDRIKLLGEIVIGDKVYGHDGLLHSVTHKFERDYSGNLIIIKPKGLPEIKTTDEHPYLVSRDIIEEYDEEVETDTGNILVVELVRKTLVKKQLLWVNAKDIVKTDKLVTPHIQYSTKFTPILWNNKKLIDVLQPDEDILWFFGLYIADGSMTKNHKISLVINSRDEAIINRASLAISKLGLYATIKNFGNYTRVHAYSAGLARKFAELFGGNSHEKHIPEILLNTKSIEHVLSGISAGDGFTRHEGQENLISSVSRELVNQIWHILSSTNKYPTIREVKKRSVGTYENASRIWTITWRPGRTNKPGLSNHIDNNFVLPIDNIRTEEYSGKVYNIEVEGVNSYILDGVSTHNCMMWGACDDTGSEPAFLVQNSWAKWNDGGHPEWGPIPDGSFLIHADVAASMLRSDSSFAFSSVNGFPPVKLPDYGSAEYL